MTFVVELVWKVEDRPVSVTVRLCQVWVTSRADCPLHSLSWKCQHFPLCTLRLVLLRDWGLWRKIRHKSKNNSITNDS